MAHVPHAPLEYYFPHEVEQTQVACLVALTLSKAREAALTDERVPVASCVEGERCDWQSRMLEFDGGSGVRTPRRMRARLHSWPSQGHRTTGPGLMAGPTFCSLPAAALPPSAAPLPRSATALPCPFACPVRTLHAHCDATTASYLRVHTGWQAHIDRRSQASLPYRARRRTGNQRVETA